MSNRKANRRSQKVSLLGKRVENIPYVSSSLNNGAKNFLQCVIVVCSLQIANILYRRYGPPIEKKVLKHIQMAVQDKFAISHASPLVVCVTISLRYKSHIFNKVPILVRRTAAILIRLRGCAGWYRSLLFEYLLRSLLSAAGPFITTKTRLFKFIENFNTKN